MAHPGATERARPRALQTFVAAALFSTILLPATLADDPPAPSASIGLFEAYTNDFEPESVPWSDGEYGGFLGYWMHGTPVRGVEAAHSGSMVWGTNLDGTRNSVNTANCYGGGDFTLTSGYIQTSWLLNPTGPLVLQAEWWQHVDLGAGQFGRVLYKHGSSGWFELAEIKNGQNATGWTKQTFGLSYLPLPWEGSIQFRFCFGGSFDNFNNQDRAGWYIDDFRLTGIHPDSQEPDTLGPYPYDTRAGPDADGDLVPAWVEVLRRTTTHNRWGHLEHQEATPLVIALDPDDQDPYHPNPAHDADHDNVPDRIEPALCEQENPYYGSDGTCQGADYAPPTIQGVRDDLDKFT